MMNSAKGCAGGKPSTPVKKSAGGKVQMTPGQQAKVSTVMGEYKKGDLHSGKNGNVVKNQKQAVAIALSEARRAGRK